MARKFDNWLKAYIQFTRDSESPTSFHFWTGVATIAGALRRRVWIDMHKFQWTPNFYIILVGPPGVAAKSTSINTGLRLLEQVEGIFFGPNSSTWQALTLALEGAQEEVKYLGLDAEEQKLPQASLTIGLSELGSFFKMEDSSMMDVLVDLWDGQLRPWRHETRTQAKIEIRNPWLNIIGCTTPAWLRAHFPEHMVGGGLTSRIIFVYGDSKRQLIPYPDEMIPSHEYRKTEEALVHDLREMATIAGPYHLSSSARKWGHEWYTRLWSNRPQHMANDRYSGYIARKQTHIHKLALVLAAARSNKQVIEDSHLAEADTLLLSVEPDMIKVFDSIGVVDESRHVAEMVAFVRFHTFLTPDQLWSLCMKMMAFKDFREGLTAALRGGVFRVAKKGELEGLVLAPIAPASPQQSPAEQPPGKAVESP